MSRLQVKITDIRNKISELNDRLEILEQKKERSNYKRKRKLERKQLVKMRSNPFRWSAYKATLKFTKNITNIFYGEDYV